MTPAPARAAARPRKGGKRWGLGHAEALEGYLFISPQLLGFLVFVMFPLVQAFVFSLQRYDLLSGQRSFIGLDNYRQVIADPLFGQVLANSLAFMAGLVPTNVILALALAFLLARKTSGVTFFRTLFFAPVVTSAAAWAIVWRFILQGEQGTLNQLLNLAGINGPNWLREPAWAMVCVIATRVIKNVGLNMVIFLAAIKSIPAQYHEAARVDGAGGWQALRYITLPLLAPTTLFVTIITVIGSLQVFDHILLLTAGGPENATNVLVYYIYQQAFRFFNVGYASSLAVALFMITLALTLAQWFAQRGATQA